MNLGLIGYGYWGPNLARLIEENRELNLKYCADLDRGALDRVKKKYPRLTVTADYGEILRDPEVDAVLIVTPTSTHFSIAKECILAGKHVFVEKPLTRDPEDASELIRLAREKEVVLMTGHIFLFNPSVQFIKETIDSGEIGSLRHLHFQRRNLGPIRQDVNVLWDLGPHDISLVLYLVDDEPVSISASGECYIQEGVHDVVSVSIKFRNKTLVNMVLSWIDPVKTRDITIVGEKKMIFFDDVAQNEKVKIFNKNVKIIEETTDVNFGEYQVALHSGGVFIPPISNKEPLKEELVHFIECIKGGKTPVSDGEQGRQVVELLDAMQRSLDEKRIIDV